MSSSAIHTQVLSGQRQAARSSFRTAGIVVLNLFATVQVTWFYLTRVVCYVNLQSYEQGLAPTPFQYRLLMMAPLRWAHSSRALGSVAAWLSTQTGWFPHGVRPEGLFEAVVDLLSLGIGGLVARELYRRASPLGVLAPYVYPLTLLLAASTYSHLAYHAYRFVADLPSMAIFSCGLLLIYTRCHSAWFAAIFILGTVNRETTLLLLLFYVLARCSRQDRLDWRQSDAAPTLAVVLPLLSVWIGWHLWVIHRFAANPTIAQPRFSLNFALLFTPFSWPQLLGLFAYTLPVVVVFRRYLCDHLLRMWLWVLPVWFVLMLFYGLLVEVRIFGELIPYMACASALIAEQMILLRLATLRNEAAGLVPLPRGA